jgi:ferrous iron transport protein A
MSRIDETAPFERLYSREVNATPMGAINFSNVKQGMKARVVAFEEDTVDARRLKEMGLTVGALFTVVKIAPFGDPVEISLRGYRLCLRKRETAHIRVEPIP